MPSSRSVTRIDVQRKCARGLTKRKIPKRDQRRGGADPQRRRVGRRAQPERRAAATSAIDASWPIAIGTSERSTARRLRSCMPERDREQPAHGRVEAVVGAEPDQGQPGRVGASRREAVRVGRGVAALRGGSGAGARRRTRTKKFGSSVSAPFGRRRA